MTVGFNDLMKWSLQSESFSKSLIWKRAWHGNYHAEQAKPCSGDVVCSWCACQAILKSGQDRLTLQASLSHCESVKGLDNRQTDADNWQPGRETKRQANKQEGHAANVQQDNTRHRPANKLSRHRGSMVKKWQRHLGGLENLLSRFSYLPLTSVFYQQNTNTGV